MPMTIPVIDLEPALKGSGADKSAVAAQIDKTCTEIGFFTIKGHGIPRILINELATRPIPSCAAADRKAESGAS